MCCVRDYFLWHLWCFCASASASNTKFHSGWQEEWSAPGLGCHDVNPFFLWCPMWSHNIAKKHKAAGLRVEEEKKKPKPKAATADSDSGLHLQVKASRRSDDLISKLASGTNGQNDLLLHVCFCCSSGKSPANRPPGPVGRGAKRRRRLPPAHGEFAATGSQNGKTLCVKK